MDKEKKFWKIQNKSEKIDELSIYGDIASYSWWGDETTPKEFQSELDKLGDISTLYVYVNSPGGDVFAAQTIYSMLERHKAKKTVYVDGLVASAAVRIVMAGDTIKISNGAMFMIHNPWSVAWGEAKDFRKMADTLDKIRESIIDGYMERTALTKEELEKMMDEETWMTAKEAVEFGFADEVVGQEKQADEDLKNKIQNLYRLKLENITRRMYK